MMMEKTLEQRCKVALECLPDARYRTMLAGLFEELLARAAVPAVQLQEPTINYAILQAWAETWNIDYNGLCRTVRAAVAAPLDAATARDAAPCAETYAGCAPDCHAGNRCTHAQGDGGTAGAQASTAVQRHITDMLVAHRDMIDAQQRGDSEAEVLAVQRMEAARSALADARPGEEQLEPFWCHEQSHDRPRCETQCAECAEDGVAEPSGEELSQAPSLDEILAVVQLYAKNPTPHNEYKVRCALRDALNLERQPQVRALMARAFEEGADAMERAAIEAVREHLSGETLAQREEVCAAWHALPDDLRQDQRLARLYHALGGPCMEEPADGGAPVEAPSVSDERINELAFQHGLISEGAWDESAVAFGRELLAIGGVQEVPRG